MSCAALCAALLPAGWLGTPVPAAASLTPPAAAEVASVLTEGPMDLTDPVTDRPGALGDEVDDLRAEIDDLRADHDLQLFVVFVDSFDGDTGEQWAEATYRKSGMGGNDVLLAVAVQDRRYSTWTTSQSGLTPRQDQRVRAQFVEPALSANDWAGAVRGAVEGYGRAADGDLGGAGAGEGGGGPSLWWLLVPAGGVALFAASRRRRRATTPTGAGWSPDRAGGRTPVPTEQLQREAAAALVNLDDAIRSSAEELAFAEAQFGVQATQSFKKALEGARQQAARAFQVQQALADDEAAGTLDESTRRAGLEEILSITVAADQTLDAQEEEFVRLRNLEATVPQFLEELRGRVQEVSGRLPAAEQELAGLAVQHSHAALETVRENVAQARDLLGSVDGFLASGQEHVAAGNRSAAVAAARAAEDAIGQADVLLTSVSGAREELAGAADRIDQALASLSSDVADAARLGADDQLTATALTEARAAIDAGTAARDGGDPLAALRRLTRAEHDLDNALARYREEDERASRGRQLLKQRMSQVAARLESVDATIQHRRGAIGAQARTHIAEAIRLYNEAFRLADEDPAQAATLLDAAEEQGEHALAAAQDDLQSWGGHHGGYAGGFGGTWGISPGSLILGGILGGALGGMAGSRGGGWGGSGGGFGGGLGGGGFGGGGRF